MIKTNEVMQGSTSRNRKRQVFPIVVTVGLILMVSTVAFILRSNRTFRQSPAVSSNPRRLVIEKRAVRSEESGSSPLQFFIAGFPKCGTTTLVFTFGRHQETDIQRMEKCVIINPYLSDNNAISRLDESVTDLSIEPNKHRGIKCPTGLKNIRSIERMQQYSPKTKLIIGVRHPIRFFESYYNYRITEIYDKKMNETIPPIESLLYDNEWKGVSTDMARFDLYLLQLGKTDVSASEMAELSSRPHMGIRPNSFQIFFYSVEQLEDRDESRSQRFRRDLQNFLGLTEGIPPFGHENTNHFVGSKAHKETVDICNDKFKDIRRLLVTQGKKSSNWIINKFLSSKDVAYSNGGHIKSLIGSWSTDPCLTKGRTSLVRPARKSLLKAKNLHLRRTEAGSMSS